MAREFRTHMRGVPGWVWTLMRAVSLLAGIGMAAAAAWASWPVQGCPHTMNRHYVGAYYYASSAPYAVSNPRGIHFFADVDGMMHSCPTVPQVLKVYRAIDVADPRFYSSEYTIPRVNPGLFYDSNGAVEVSPGDHIVWWMGGVCLPGSEPGDNQWVWKYEHVVVHVL